MRVLDLFSGAAGGWSLGLHRAGFHTYAACEVVDWRRALYSENNPHVRVFEDVCALTADRLVRELGCLPDVIVGSPPCQDISSANTRGKGVDGERSGLFFEAIRLVGECRPRWVALENSANLRTRGADRVLGALEAHGYTCGPAVVRARDVGANHERRRAWILAFDADQIVEGALGDVLGRPGAFGQGSAAADSHGDGRPAGRRGRRGIDVPIQDDPEHAPRLGREGGRSWGRGPDGHGAPSVARGVPADADRGELREQPGRVVWPSWSGASLAERDDEHAHGHGQPDRPLDAEMGGSPRAGGAAAEPWADWNGGLAGHLRVDDGLSAWVAQQRVAVGGPRGTAAASLLVEAFGDSVLPQIPEAIGRAILRTEAALAAIYAPQPETCHAS